MSIKVNGKYVAGRGKNGENGKSAYDYAVAGGFTGTEAEFQALMAKAENLDGGPFLPLIGGTVTGNVNFNNFLISNRLLRISEYFGTVGYSDNSATIHFHNNILYFGNFSGVVLSADGVPTSNSHLTNKKYVDESIQSAILDSWAKAY